MQTTSWSWTIWGPEEAEREQAAAHRNALFNFLEHTVGHAQVTPRADTNSAGKSSGDQVTMEQENGLNKMMAAIHLVQRRASWTWTQLLTLFW